MQATSEQPREGSFLVYLNGIEIPAQSVSVSMGLWVIPTATIEVAPDVELQRLGAEDRVQVAIFYLDYDYTAQMGLPPDFRLLFEGEIVGWSYVNSATMRAMRFQCVNYMRMLDDLYTFFMTSLEDYVQGATSKSVLAGSVMGVSGFGPTFPASLLLEGLGIRQTNTIRRPFDLIENVLRTCTGVAEQQEFASVVATNFFSPLMRRIGFIDRFVPSPMIEIEPLRSDDVINGVFPILKYVRYQECIDTFKRRMEQMSNNSVWGILRDLFSKLYYEVAMITTAPCSQVLFDTNVIKGVRGEILGPADFGKAEAGKDVLSQFRATTPNRILNYVTKPQWLFGVPPACNVIYPSMITHFALDENYADQPTRVYVNDTWVINHLSTSPLAQMLMPDAGYPPQVEIELLRRRGMAGNSAQPALNSKNFLVWPEEFFKGPKIVEEALPEWFRFLMEAALKNDPQVTPTKTTYENDPLSTANKAPKPPDPKDGQLTEGTTESFLDQYFAHQQTEHGAPANQSASYKKCLWLMEIYARYEYGRQRAAHRNGSVSMVFNPYVVPNFPVVVFDNVTTGNHIVGYAAQVTHNLSVRGGNSTQVTFTHAQLLDEYLHGIRESRAGENPEARTYIVSASPPNPIPELRQIEQVWENAEAYFGTLFHQRRVYQDPLKTAAFNLESAVRLELPSGDIKPLAYEGDNAKFLDTYSRIIPTSEYTRLFDEASAALRFTARPICTLKEFTLFMEKGIQKTVIPAAGHPQSKGGVFYEQILNLVQGPGDQPAFDPFNNLAAPVTADTRSDWKQRLLNYRTKVLSQKHPQES